MLASRARTLILGLALAPVACTPPPRPGFGLDPASPEAIAAARDDYRAACAPRHGLGARGDGPVAASLRTPPADLTRLAARHGGTFPTDDVVAVLAGERPIAAHGTRTMPIWSLRLGAEGGATAVASIHTQRRLTLLAGYLASLQRGP